MAYAAEQQQTMQQMLNTMSFEDIQKLMQAKQEETSQHSQAAPAPSMAAPAPVTPPAAKAGGSTGNAAAAAAATMDAAAMDTAVPASPLLASKEENTRKMLSPEKDKRPTKRSANQKLEEEIDKRRGHRDNVEDMQEALKPF